jgi:hypothetical protein
MKKLMQKLFLSCLKATQLIEKKFYIKLNFSEKLQLRLHKTMCKACSNFDKQSILIENAFKNQIKPEKIDIENFIIEIKKKIETS